MIWWPRLILIYIAGFVSLVVGASVNGTARR
jgi:hypothetical protein